MRSPLGQQIRTLLAIAVSLGLVVVAAPVAAAPSAPSAAAGYPDSEPVTGDTRVHDPAMVRAKDGRYVLVTTGDNLQMLTSADRVDFQRVGAVWPDGAPWTTQFTLGSPVLWAPDISRHNGRYYLYYSASSFGSQNSAIFLVTSPSAMPGTWTHHGIVTQTSSANDYNAIDPNLVVDASGRWWLSFGSFWSGIKMIRIDPATGMRHTGDRTLYALAQRPLSVEGAIEAPFIIRRGGFYYLFVSFDFCCRGTNSTYRVMVGRSRSVTGPYVDRAGVSMTSGGGTEILATHGGVHGPGHEALIRDGGDWLMLYHYYSDAIPTGTLGINHVTWPGGWPRLV